MRIISKGKYNNNKLFTQSHDKYNYNNNNNVRCNNGDRN